METEDIIRKYLMLHPDTQFDMTEYMFPLLAVKQLLETAVAAEREACAKVCESVDDGSYAGGDQPYGRHYAAAIRARRKEL